MKLRALLAGLALLTLAATASAQYRGGTVEINPFAGYLFGGNFGHFDDFGDFHHTRVDVDDHVAYGGRVGYNFTSMWEVEVEYAESNTHLELEGDRHGNLPDQRIGDMKFEYFLAYMTVNFGGSSRFVPYFTIGSGGANLVPFVPGTFSTAEVRYTAGAGGGIKIFLNPHFAFRLDTRAYSTYVNDSHTVCGPNFCTDRTWVTNVVGNGGFIVAF